MTEKTKAENSKKTMAQKLIEVSKAIGYLQKDKTNKMQGYNYLSEAKIKETIKKEFETQGIVFNYSTEAVREYEINPTSKGTKQFVTIANGTYHFIDSESDIDIEGKWFGSGSDTGDKGLYKAITGGIKYVLNTNFLIPTGDDPEKDNDDSGDGDSKTITKTAKKDDIPKPEPAGNGAIIIGKKTYTTTDIKNLFVDFHNGDKDEAREDYELWEKLEAEKKLTILKDMTEMVKVK